MFIWITNNFFDDELQFELESKIFIFFDRVFHYLYTNVHFGGKDVSKAPSIFQVYVRKSL